MITNDKLIDYDKKRSLLVVSVFKDALGGSMKKVMCNYVMLCNNLVLQKNLKGHLITFQREINSKGPYKWPWVTDICTCYMTPCLCLYFTWETVFKTKIIFFIKLLEYVLTKSDWRTQPKIFWESCFVWLVCKIPAFFLQAGAWRSGGSDLQFALVVVSKYDSRLTFFFLVEAEGLAYLSKPEEFSLQLWLIQGGL